jgi:uncharacterized membrane protein SpoIIM required for sporulation
MAGHLGIREGGNEQADYRTKAAEEIEFRRETSGKAVMDLDTFIHKRQPQWKQLEAVLRRVEGSGLGSLDEEQAVEFGRLYRCTASDLNQAQTFVRGDATVQYLNDLVARCYLVIYAKTKVDLWGLVRYLFWGYPAVFRRNMNPLLLATAITLAGTLLGFLLAYYDRDSRFYLLPENMSIIQPGDEGHSLTSGQLAGASMAYFTHNTSVSIFAFALGITLGIGTAWLMFYNGIMLGALCAIFVEAGAFDEFCTGILPHGVLEIPAIIIGGAAGFVLARGMIRARPWPRLEAIADASKEALFLLFGCVPLMAMAGVLEAGVARAPEWVISSGVKLVVAGIFATMFTVYLSLLGWKWNVRPPAVAGRS